MPLRLTTQERVKSSIQKKCERDEPKRCENLMTSESIWRLMNQKCDRQQAIKSGQRQHGLKHERTQTVQQYDVDCVLRKWTHANRDLTFAATPLEIRATDFELGSELQAPASKRVDDHCCVWFFFGGVLSWESAQGDLRGTTKGPSQEGENLKTAQDSLRNSWRESSVCDVRRRRTHRSWLSEKCGGAVFVLVRNAGSTWCALVRRFHLLHCRWQGRRSRTNDAWSVQGEWKSVNASALVFWHLWNSCTGRWDGTLKFSPGRTIRNTHTHWQWLTGLVSSARSNLSKRSGSYACCEVYAQTFVQILQRGTCTQQEVSISRNAKWDQGGDSCELSRGIGRTALDVEWMDLLWWSSARPQIVVLSAAESECISITKGAAHALEVRSAMVENGMPLNVVCETDAPPHDRQWVGAHGWWRRVSRGCRGSKRLPCIDLEREEHVRDDRLVLDRCCWADRLRIP